MVASAPAEAACAQPESAVGDIARRLTHFNFRIHRDKLWNTAAWWNYGDVDWDAFKRTPSSMILPLHRSAVGDPPGSSASGSAVGDCRFLVRRVLAFNFPSLCWVFHNIFTAAELVEAWECMPLVRVAKGGRAVNAGRQQWRWNRNE